MADNNTNSRVLTDKFAMLVCSAHQMEKADEKIYRMMVKKAFTDELSKCLSPISTDYLQHIQRIKLIRRLIREKEQAPTSKLERLKLSFKKPDFQQDLEMFELALRYQHEKLAIYEILHPLAVNLNHEIEVELIAQTIEDHRNTNKWLRQIVQNIIIPNLKIEEPSKKKVEK